MAVRDQPTVDARGAARAGVMGSGTRASHLKRRPDLADCRKRDGVVFIGSHLRGEGIAGGPHISSGRKARAWTALSLLCAPAAALQVYAWGNLWERLFFFFASKIVNNPG